jgi:hypothetical protein
MSHMTTSHRDHEGLLMISRLVRQNSQTARRAVLVAVLGLVGALALSACGSNASGGGAPTAPSTGSSSSSSSGTGNRGNFAAPAASGTVAQISGTTMQVQNAQSGQVAVSWSSTTKFSHAVATTLAAVKAGDCLVAVAKTGTSSSATSFTAATLAVSSPVNGSCTGGTRGPGGGSGQRPSGFPSGGQRPSGAPTGTRGFGAFASGKVTSVSGSAVVMAAQGFGSSGATTTTKTVTADSATKITTEAATTSSSLKVGKCVTAQGKADSSGTVAATSVRITDPTAGQCTTGFGGPNGG